jgi:hypothetical protein
MKQAAEPQDARHRYIDILRSLNPDAVLSKRLDAVESTPKVLVTLDDVRDVVTRKLAELSNEPVSRQHSQNFVNTVVAELDEKLDLVGEHNMTTALRADTVYPWIEMQIDGALGEDGFNEVIQHSLRMT